MVTVYGGGDGGGGGCSDGVECCSGEWCLQ